MKMNVKSFLFIFLFIFLVGCGSVYEEVVVEETVPKNPLAGTCPNGLSCTAPSCGAWVDADFDGACDRGV